MPEAHQLIVSFRQVIRHESAAGWSSVVGIEGEVDEGQNYGIGGQCWASRGLRVSKARAFAGVECRLSLMEILEAGACQLGTESTRPHYQRPSFYSFFLSRLDFS